MTLFLDMDGVIADFFSLLAKLNNVHHWKQIKSVEQALLDICQTDFFNQIEPFQISRDLIKFAQNFGDWGICSSPLKNDINNSTYWKKVWLKRHGFMPSQEKCIFTLNKHKYARNAVSLAPNILVDDKPDNIWNWVNAGGIGIRFQADQDDFGTLINQLSSIQKLRLIDVSDSSLRYKSAS